jgi:hypothetical protein
MAGERLDLVTDGPAPRRITPLVALNWAGPPRPGRSTQPPGNPVASSAAGHHPSPPSSCLKPECSFCYQPRSDGGAPPLARRLRDVAIAAEATQNRSCMDVVTAQGSGQCRSAALPGGLLASLDRCRSGSPIEEAGCPVVKHASPCGRGPTGPTALVPRKRPRAPTAPAAAGTLRRAGRHA